MREFVVAGACLGAALAVRVAARHPESVRAPATVVGVALPRTTLRLNPETWASPHVRGDATLGVCLTALSFSESYLAALPAEVVQQVIEQSAGGSTPGSAEQIALPLGIDVREDLPATAMPTPVDGGHGGPVSWPRSSVELAEGIAGARLVRIPGGHAAVFEDPSGTGEALAGLLEGLHS